MRTKKGFKDEVGGPISEKDLVVDARETDRRVREAVKLARRSLAEVGALLARIKQLRLWKYLPRKFSTFDAYVQEVLGVLSRSTVYEIVAAHSLTQGSNGLPAETINRLGVKRAYQLSRLEPNQRTPELVQEALKAPVARVRGMVQHKINETAPPEEQREPLILFARNYPASVIARFEELEERAVWLEGIMDGDRTLPLRAKVMVAMCANFEANYAEELLEADKRRVAAAEVKQRLLKKAAGG